MQAAINNNHLPFNVVDPSQWSEQARALKREIQLKPGFFSGLIRNERKAIQNKINSVEPGDLFQVIVNLLQEELLQHPDADPMLLIEKLTEVIPFEKLQNAVKSIHVSPEDALVKAKEMVDDALYFFENSKDNRSPSVKGQVITVLNGFKNVIGSFVNAFGIGDLFKSSDSEAQSQHRAQKVMMLIGVMSMLISILIPTLGPQLGGMIMGSIVLSVTALSIAFPYISGMPARLPKAQNWSYKSEMGKLEVTNGRKSIQTQIYDALRECKMVNRFPLLLGKTGVGKTETAKAFTESLKKGAFPELDGKEVFYINCAEIAKEGGGDMYGSEQNPLTRLSKAMGSHRKNIILVLDEIQALFQDPTSTMAIQLKSLLDKGDENFPFVIALTTAEEFAINIEKVDEAFARRFKTIVIENTSDIETLSVLADICAKQDPNTLIEDGSLEFLYAEAEKHFSHQTAQPAASINLLQQCLTRTKESNKTKTQEQIDKLEEEYETIRALRSSGQRKALKKYNLDTKTPRQIKAEIASLKLQAKREKRSYETFNNQRKMMYQAKMKMFKTVEKTEKMREAHLSKKDRQELNRFMLLNEVFGPVLENHVISEANVKDVKVRIDKKLVSDVVEAEFQSRKRKEELIAKAKKNREERQKENSVVNLENVKATIPGV